MKKIYFFFIALAQFSSSSAQGLIWSEDFGTGCNSGQLAYDYVGNNGAWSVTDFTSSNNAANKFYVSATEAGMGVGNCGDGCLASGGTNATLHIGGVYVEYMSIPLQDADPGAAYNVGGIQAFGFVSETNIVTQSPFIDCSGYDDMMLSFEYLEGGDGALDDANLRYYNGNNWVTVDLPKTMATCPGGQGLWTSFSLVLPSEVNGISNFRIAFGWINNDDGLGSDPSFAVDNITLTEVVPTSIENASIENLLNIIAIQGGIEVAFADVDEEIMVVNVFDLLGRSVIQRAGNGNSNMLIDTADLHGIFVLQVETAKGPMSRKVVLN